MKKKDIEQLATLSRIELKDDETCALAEDITAIIGYVSEINNITSEISLEKKVGVVHNVMREDENPHEIGIYTEDILDNAPTRKGQYIEVKKILGDDS